MDSKPLRAFAAEDLSVVLQYYVEAELARGPGGAEAVRRLLADAQGRDGVRRALTARLNADDPQVLSRLRRIPLAEGVDVSGVLRCDAYRERVLDAAVERLRIGTDAPALRIAPGAGCDVAGGIRFALIFGAETTLFQDTVLALQADEQTCRDNDRETVHVLGVHHAWLGGKMRARRALVVDRPGRVCEVGFQRPQRLDVAAILHLPRACEIDLHRRLSAACADAQSAQINPYGMAAACADDKIQAYKRWRRARLATPLARRVARGRGRREVAASALALLHGRPVAQLVVQPVHGTEGRQVEAAWVRAEDPALLRGEHPLVAHAVEHILPCDDLLVREARGNLWFCAGQERRRIAFRIHVAWNGERFVAESGFAQVAPDAVTFAASRGRGGQVVPIDEAFRALCYRHKGTQMYTDRGKTGPVALPEDAYEYDWKRFVPTPCNIETLCETAARAAAAVNSGLSEPEFLKYMGIDIVLEVDGSRFTPVVLEANARPAGLASSCEIVPSRHRRGKPKITYGLYRLIRQLWT